MPLSKSWMFPFLVGGVLVACESPPSEPPKPPPVSENPVTVLTPKQRLGRALFFDEWLSEPPGQSCAVCHLPSTGWTGPDMFINATGAVYEGAVDGRFGNRKPPSSAYATPAPILHLEGENTFVGGNFWDGRATGEELGNPAADQAQGPFLNPVEQNNPNEAVVVQKVCIGSYGDLFRFVYGADICSEGNVERAYDSIALAIAAYEDSPEVNAFTSKYDAYLAGRAQLTPQEAWGLELFEGKGLCANCHPSSPGPNGEPPLFTDFTYDNLGVPRNPLNPWYYQFEFNPLGPAWTDYGLGAFLLTRPEWRQLARENLGMQKVPTLRNVDKRPYPAFIKAFMHNGVFKDLKTVVRFYNTRDVLPVCLAEVPEFSGTIGVDCWPPPEVGLNVNVDELGNLGLTPEEEDAIVAFMSTLSDGYFHR